MPEPGASPEGPKAPGPRPRKRHSVRQSVRVFLRRRGISIRRRRRGERLSLPLAGLAALAFVPLIFSWEWFRDPDLPWINMGRSRSVFPMMLAAALVIWVLFVTNLADVLRAQVQSRTREKEKENEERKE